jgi:LPXTG-motif cell wall-anchored protein
MIDGKTIQIIAGVLAVIVLGIIIYRRKQNSN